MDNNFNISEKYLKLLDSNENVIWGKERDSKSLTRVYVFICIIVFLGSMIYLTGNTNSISSALLFSAIISLTIGLLLDNLIPKQKTSQIVTTNRILLADSYKYNPPISIYYKDIYGISSFGNKITIHNSPNNFRSTSHSEFPVINNMNTANFELLKSIWFKKSQFTFYIKQFRKIAKTYDLEFNEKEAKNNLSISLKGDINNMPFEFTLNNMFTMSSLDITMACPSRQNSLYIKHNSGSSSIGKLFGNQHMETDNHLFNESYSLKSNDAIFFKEIMNPKMVDSVLKSNQYLQGFFSFDYRFLNKNLFKKKNDILENILDDDFLYYGKHGEINTSYLNYSTQAILKLNNVNKVCESAIEILKTTIDLGKKITAYNRLYYE